MARVSAHGHIVATFLSRKAAGLIRHMSDGTVLRKTPFSGGWKIYGQRKPGVTDEQLREKVAALADWKRVTRIPSIRTLEEWGRDSVCETPSGHQVEPDGYGPVGSPSWLLLFRLI